MSNGLALQARADGFSEARRNRGGDTHGTEHTDSHPTPDSHVNSVADDKVISQYKFFLAFENCVFEGYVSEKLFTPLRLGVVPVYLGSADVAELPSLSATGDPWFVNAWDFETPKHLAGYLKHLSANETAWMRYHTWRGGAEGRGISADAPYSAHARAYAEHLERAPLLFRAAKSAHTRQLPLYELERRAQACLLCNRSHLAHLLAERPIDVRERGMWTAKEVAERFKLNYSQHLKHGESQGVGAH